jgi:hypothetical protein
MMTRARMIEILTSELAKSEQMTTADCRRWIERGMAKVEEAEEHERMVASLAAYFDWSAQP